MPTRELDELAEVVKSAFNTLSAGHVSWEYSLETSERNTAEVLDILLKDMERKQSEYEEKMVRIGLDALRHGETVLGRPLTKDEVRPMLQSYGLTEEQMRRVEDQYSLGAEGSDSS